MQIQVSRTLHSTRDNRPTRTGLEMWLALDQFRPGLITRVALGLVDGPVHLPIGPHFYRFSALTLVHYDC